MKERIHPNYRPSWWESDTFWRGIDVAIIGAGIVGLSAAIRLKKQRPQDRVVVLDRGVLPLGASTRNAGFACFGSPTELIDDLSHRPEEEVWSLVKRRWEGLRSLRRLLGDNAIGYRDLGGYEVFGPKDEASFELCTQALPKFNKRLREICGLNEVFQQADDRIDRLGLGATNHLIRNSAEGQLDTGKLIFALLDMNRKLGVEIFNGLAVAEWSEEQDQVAIFTKEGWPIYAKQLLIATNGLAKHMLPEDLDIRPVRNQVVISEPIKRLKLRGCFHYEKGYFYFRNVGQRILIGGGRHLAGTAEETDRFGLTPEVQGRLEELIRNVVAPGHEVEIAQRWSGVLGVGEAKSPIIKRIGSRTVAAVRLGGMGVAIGGWVGERAADMMN